jgi:cytochrome c-type biogenesis protein CcmH
MDSNRLLRNCCGAFRKARALASPSSAPTPHPQPLFPREKGDRKVVGKGFTAGLKPRPCGWAIGILFASLLTARAARADNAHPPTLESLGNQVECMCGCVAPLNQCPHINCATRTEMQAFMKKEIAEGKGETVILQDLALRYGVQVLAVPPARGFNLAIWILPGVGLLVGLGVVVVIVRRWRGTPASRSPAAASIPADPKMLRAVEEEMKSTGLG